jgi:hypothetical protein
MMVERRFAIAAGDGLVRVGYSRLTFAAFSALLVHDAVR